MGMQAVVQGIGHSIPEKKLTNLELERMVKTSDEWIIQRTGIRERRVSEPHQTTSTFAIDASRKALAMAKMDPKDLDLVICATVTGDMLTPSTSCLVQDAIGAHRAGAFDVGAACAGFIYALNVATAMIEARQVRNVLVIGADTLTKFVDWTDRATCVLFGDAGAAVVLSGQQDTDRGVLKTVLLADGEGAKYIDIEVGGSACPSHAPGASQKQKYIRMDGQEVYRFAVKAFGDACCKVLDAAGLTPDDVDLFVPHQANIRIIESAMKRMELPDSKVFLNVDKYGNTSAASIPLALSEAVLEGRLKEGMIVLTVGFGAGLVWGANVIRW
jgi:3-oxoacyl-[acyl-carrier-protein] synthase-3